MDVAEIVKKPAFKWAAGVVAVVGLVVFLRRPASGGLSGSSDTQGAVNGPVYGGTGRIDTTGTDVASWLGQYSGSLQNQLTEYSKTLADATQSLAAGQVFSAAGGQSLSDVAAAAGVSQSDVLAANPWLPGYLRDANAYGFISPSNPIDRPGGGTPGKVFWANAPVKLPPPPTNKK